MDEYELLQWTPERIAKFWDFERRYPQRYFSFGQSNEILDFFNLKRFGVKRILDYGCGLGHLVKGLIKRGYFAGGLDYSAPAVRAMRDELQSFDSFAGGWISDDQTIPDNWDAIFCCEVVEHLDDRELLEVTDRIKSLLSPGGYLFLTTPNEEKLEDGYIMCPSTGEVFHRVQHVRSWSAGTLTAHFTRNGFNAIQCQATWFRKKSEISKCEIIKKWFVAPRPPFYTPHLTGIFQSPRA